MIHTLIIATGALVCASGGASHEPLPHPTLETVIVEAVRALVGTRAEIAVEMIEAPANTGRLVGATALPGARAGQPVRFSLRDESGRASSALACVTLHVEHVIAQRAIPRGSTIGPGDVVTRVASLDGVALQRLPSMDEALQSHSRRAIAAGEVLVPSVLQQPWAVRAGDAITITVRHGPVAVSGPGRAVSSGRVGDVIRVSHPGARATQRAQVIAPAAVELLQ